MWSFWQMSLQHLIYSLITRASINPNCFFMMN